MKIKSVCINLIMVLVLALLCTPILAFAPVNAAEGDTHTITYKEVILGSSNITALANPNNPATYIEGEGLTLNNPPQKLGTTFACWLDITNGYDAFNPIVITAIPSNATENYVLLAAYELIEYNLNYNYGEGVKTEDVIAPKKNTFTIADTIDLTGADYVPELFGFKFNGWFYDEALLQPATNIAAGTTGDLTLYAKFSEIIITVSFEGADFDDINLKYGALLPKEYHNPTRDGYKFDGWYTTENFDKYFNVEKDQIVKENLVLYAKWIKEPDSVWWIIVGCLLGVTLIAAAVWFIWFRPTKLMDKIEKSESNK